MVKNWKTLQLKGSSRNFVDVQILPNARRQNKKFYKSENSDFLGSFPKNSRYINILVMHMLRT